MCLPVFALLFQMVAQLDLTSTYMIYSYISPPRQDILHSNVVVSVCPALPESCMQAVSNTVITGCDDDRKFTFRKFNFQPAN